MYLLDQVPHNLCSQYKFECSLCIFPQLEFQSRQNELSSVNCMIHLNLIYLQNRNHCLS